MNIRWGNHRILGLGLLAVAGACTPTGSAPPQPPPVPSPPASASVAPLAASPTTPTLIDPVGQGMTVEGVKALCDDNLAMARGILDEIRALDPEAAGSLTWDSTLARFDDATLAIFNASEFPYLMGVSHPEEAVREAAKDCETKTDELVTGIYLDPKLAAVFKAYAAKEETLTPERQRFLEHTLRDFRRNGLELPPEEQRRLRAINEEITEVGQRFVAEIGDNKGTLSLEPEQLAGLPADFRKKHAPGPSGKVTITTDYPDYYPFVKYAEDREAAKELYVKFTNRGGDVNVGRLERILKLRAEKAKMLGYSTWADYAIEPRMAKDAKTVGGFLDRMNAAIAPSVTKERRLFRRTYDQLGGRNKPMYPSDRYFLEEQIKKRQHQLDTQELAQYFEIDAVTQGLLDLTAKMYGLVYTPVKTKTWHPSVQVFDVAGKDGRPIGRFFLDLQPRDNKYKHAAMFTVRSPKVLADGTRQTPMAALVCNFPGPGEPMPHDQVETYFHEFGHVLHHILTDTELVSFAGTNTVRDFVETPSQMFEEWAWNKKVLDRFTKHLESGKPLPQKLYDAMVASRRAGLALATERQLYLARLDLAYHTGDPSMDTNETLKEIHEEHFSFTYVPGSQFQSSFGHLIGYDAGYYGYQWALALAHDVHRRFAAEGLFNPEVAKAWRSDVLSKGGSRDPKVLLTTFLGREPSEEAYAAFLRGD